MTTTRRRIRHSQPVAGFCQHGLRSTQVVAFLLRPGPALAYKLAGEKDGPERLFASR
jgi:hypothetical protein